MLHPNRCGCFIGFFILLNIPVINYHPMALLPSIASYSSNIANLLSKPLSCHRFDTLIGDIHSPFAASAASTATANPVDLTPTIVASTTAGASTVVASPTTSASVPVALDTGAPFARTPFASDFALEIAQAPYGLIRSAFDTSVASDSNFDTSVASDSKAYSKVASTPVDPYTLITGEDVSVSFDSDPIDLSSTDPTLASDLVESFEFGTASLTFIYSNLDLIKVFVTPTQVDWLHWIPLPRLTLTESYRHIFGLDYLQAFALFHLIPIWIYYLLHFAVNLEV